MTTLLLPMWHRRMVLLVKRKIAKDHANHIVHFCVAAIQIFPIPTIHKIRMRTMLGLPMMKIALARTLQRMCVAQLRESFPTES